MASRTRQKEEARARRLAEEQARGERQRRQRRLRMLAGVVLAAIAVVVVAIVISSNSGKSGLQKGAQASKTSASVNSMLAGIPQSGNTLGSPTARTTVTEFGDLQCPICRDFALSSENQLISNDVRSGKVKLVYRSLMTATGNGPDPSIFVPQQASAYAAGLQRLAWNYILLFYHEQGQEDTAYVNDAYLNGLAHQIPGLDFAKWSSDRKSSTLAAQVNQDMQAAQSAGYNSTPTIVVSGPKGQAQPIVGDPSSYGQLEQVINSVQ